MNIGVTGTRGGMTGAQVLTCIELMRKHGVNEDAYGGCTLLHGDCIGADHQAWIIATALGWESEAYPSDLDEKWHANTPSTVIHNRRHPLARNRLIVDNADRMLAFPFQMEEADKGGTWYTIRYARQTRTALTIVWPDGLVR